MYFLIHRNVDGAGIIEDEVITKDERGYVRRIERKTRQYDTFDAAKYAALQMQLASDQGGNPWGYAYSVHSWGSDGALYRTYPAS